MAKKIEMKQELLTVEACLLIGDLDFININTTYVNIHNIINILFVEKNDTKSAFKFKQLIDPS